MRYTIICKTLVFTVYHHYYCLYIYILLQKPSHNIMNRNTHSNIFLTYVLRFFLSPTFPKAQFWDNRNERKIEALPKKRKRERERKQKQTKTPHWAVLLIYHIIKQMSLPREFSLLWCVHGVWALQYDYKFRIWQKVCLTLFYIHTLFKRNYRCASTRAGLLQSACLCESMSWHVDVLFCSVQAFATASAGEMIAGSVLHSGSFLRSQSELFQVFILNIFSKMKRQNRRHLPISIVAITPKAFDRSLYRYLRRNIPD